MSSFNNDFDIPTKKFEYELSIVLIGMLSKLIYAPISNSSKKGINITWNGNENKWSSHLLMLIRGSMKM